MIKTKSQALTTLANIRGQCNGTPYMCGGEKSILIRAEILADLLEEIEEFIAKIPESAIPEIKE